MNTTSSVRSRSLQAGPNEASILLQLLQGESGTRFAQNNAGWDSSTAGEFLFAVRSFQLSRLHANTFLFPKKSATGKELNAIPLEIFKK